MASRKEGGAGSGEPERAQVRLDELVEDRALYPRGSVSAALVAEYTQAYGAGKKLPPLIVDAATLRIVDGVHRARALARILGSNGVATVELRHYASEDDLLKDAIHVNNVHGLRLNKEDRVRCVALLEERGVAAQEIALVLSIRTEDLPELKVRIFEAPREGPGTIPGTNKVVVTGAPVDRLCHIEERTLTMEQARALASAPGTNYTLLARQLYDGLEYGFVNLGRARFVAAMDRLCAAWARMRDEIPDPEDSYD
jgi:hypothetical protein